MDLPLSFQINFHFGPYSVKKPPLNFEASPAGIDARKVVDTAIAPVINTGIAHRHAGVGQVGAGITRAPLECFEKAIVSLRGAE